MKKDEPFRHLVKKTRFGPAAILWESVSGKPRVRQILLTKPGQPVQAALQEQFPGSVPSSCGLIDDLAGRIAAFLDGADVHFALGHVRLDLCPPFQRKVLLAEYGIPRGRVSTYRRIATHLGIAGGARAVGNALATNPFPIVIPCHRAIRSDGTLGGYQGGLAMKRALLEQEGVDIDERGRVESAKFYY
ncbi:MAG TPA: MGMT family protein [Syntrophales bacterium]|nr:MGMT family protein [Syntrophales bacterium]